MVGCLPSQIKCERFQLQPFVRHLNERWGTEFVYQDCLDNAPGDTPQPEVRYRDVSGRTDRDLVIERKHLVWPADHVGRHKKDHHVADRILASLDGLLTDAPYEIELPYLITGTSRELDAFVQEVVDIVRSNLVRLRTGGLFGAHQGPRPWCVRRQESIEREYNEPDIGLVIRWTDNSDLLDPAVRTRMIEDLTTQVCRFREACERKFAGYPHAVRVLLIEPVDNLWIMDQELLSLFSSHAFLQSEISEVWMSEDEWVSDSQSRRRFRQMLPEFEPSTP